MVRMKGWEALVTGGAMEENHVALGAVRGKNIVEHAFAERSVNLGCADRNMFGSIYDN